MDDADLAGPLFFCLAFGVFLLLTGKVSYLIQLLSSIYSALITEEGMHHGLLIGRLSMSVFRLGRCREPALGYKP